MLISIDENGIVTQWNYAAEKSTGIPATEIMGKNIWEATNLFQDYRNVCDEIAEKKKPVHLYRKPLQDQDQDRLYNVSLYPLAENCMNGIVVRMDDITLLEKTEDMLRQSQKMETVGTLASGLAHDLNNVLGGVTGTVSIMEFKISKGNALSIEALKGYIETIKKSSQRITDMIKQLLSFSRKSEKDYVPVDLNLTIKHVMKICKGTMDKSIELRPYPTDAPAMINADPVQIEQVLLNFCVNASHAMTIMRKDGNQGGILSVYLRMIDADKLFCTSHPEAQLGAEYWVLSVEDTGIGMDSKTIAKIFDPFFTTKEKGKGTGLGTGNGLQHH
jgi:Signal transduction histidine kinase, nitrogen specific